MIDGPKKNLTRRANQGHINIIARIDTARAEKSAAGFLFFQSDGGRTSRCLISQRPSPEASSARRRPNLSSLAGTRERAGVRRGAEATAASDPCSRDTDCNSQASPKPIEESASPPALRKPVCAGLNMLIHRRFQAACASVRR
jgi:hypothetical protein